jgi:DNA-binding beta-propeller fold protein YncE
MIPVVSTPDSSGFKITENISLGKQPTGLVIDPVMNKLYVASFSSILVVNMSSNNLIGDITVGSRPSDLVINSLTQKLYSSAKFETNAASAAGANESSSEVFIIDTVQNRIQNILKLNQIKAVDTARNILYGLSEQSNSVNSIDGHTYKTIEMAKVISPSALAFDKTGDKVYVISKASPAVTILNATTLKQIGEVNVRNSILSNIAFDSKDQKLYVIGKTPMSLPSTDGLGIAQSIIYQVDALTHTVTRDIEINAATDIAVDDVSGKVYVTVTGSAFKGLTVIDGNTGRLVENIETGLYPYAVAVNSKAHQIYVANGLSNTISVISDQESRPLSN